MRDVRIDGRAIPQALLRIAPVAAVTVVLILLSVTPVAAQQPPRRDDADGNKIFDDLDALIAPTSLDRPFPVMVLIDQPLTAQRLRDLGLRAGQFDTAHQYPASTASAPA